MAAKKSFVQNIATEAIDPFFSKANEEPVEEKTPQEGRYAPFKRIDPETYKPITEEPAKPSKEIRSRRVQLLLKPSVFADLEKIAHMKRKSSNGLINELIAALIESEQETIATYDKLYGDI